MALLSVQDLVVRFRTRRQTVHAVNGVSLDVEAGETMGLVGESGCGKSVTSLAIMRLLPRPAGHIEGGALTFDQRDLTRLSESEMRRLRGSEIAMIFQDPMTSLNPVLTIGEQLVETIRAHRRVDQAEARDQALALLRSVGVGDAADRLTRYPHQLSGGMRQRVMISMALALRPRLLIADEPTTALDVTVQAQVLELLRRLVSEHQTAMILITHDMGVIAGMTTRVSVMYAGFVVESGATSELFELPKHPYTVGLLHSMPRLDAPIDRPLVPIEGLPPDLRQAPVGCPFAPRCRWRLPICWTNNPPLAPIGISSPDKHPHLSACWSPPTEAEAARGRPERPGFVAAPMPERSTIRRESRWGRLRSDPR